METEHIGKGETTKFLESSPVDILNVAVSPHIASADSVARIMWTVVLALLPATVFGVYHFGKPALIIIIVSVLSSVLFEAIVLKIRKRKLTISDGSACVTGLLLALCLPSSVPIYMPIIGSFVAIVIAKHSMGGLGHNIFNPALIGRAALMLSWPVAMTSWTGMTTAADAITNATPLNILKHQGYSSLIEIFGSYPQMYKTIMLGFRNGCIGETATLLLIVGGVLLIMKKYIDWTTPVMMIGTVAILTWILGPTGLLTGDPLFHIMSGGLVLGAFFMATDMVTTPS
jgi:electron transport complex protein RnfD